MNQTRTRSNRLLPAAITAAAGLATTAQAGPGDITYSGDTASNADGNPVEFIETGVDRSFTCSTPFIEFTDVDTNGDGEIRIDDAVLRISFFDLAGNPVGTPIDTAGVDLFDFDSPFFPLFGSDIRSFDGGDLDLFNIARDVPLNADIIDITLLSTNPFDDEFADPDSLVFHPDGLNCGAEAIDTTILIINTYCSNFAGNECPNNIGTFTFNGSDNGTPFAFTDVTASADFTTGPRGFAITDAQIGTSTNAFDSAGAILIDGQRINPVVQFIPFFPTDTFAVYSWSTPSRLIGLDIALNFFPDRALLAQTLFIIDSFDGLRSTFSLSVESNSGNIPLIADTQSGDLDFDATDDWIIAGDGVDNAGAPATSFIFGLGNPTVAPANVTRTVFDNNGADGFGATFSLDIPDGGFQQLTFLYELNETQQDALDDIADFDSARSLLKAGLLDLVRGSDNFQLDENLWLPSNGGNFFSSSNWLLGTPNSLSPTVIDAALPQVIDLGSGGFADLASLDIRADIGRTALQLNPDGLLNIRADLDLPASGELRNHGAILVAPQFTNNGTTLVNGDDATFAAPVFNNGNLRLRPDSARGPLASALFADTLTNNADIALIDAVDAEVVNGITNNGAIDVAFAQATLTADILNNEPGAIAVAGESRLAVFGDVNNLGGIAVAADSHLLIFGALSGNGVNAFDADGGSGNVFIRDGILPPEDGLGQTAFAGDLTLGATANTTLRIAGPTPGVNAGQLRVDGRLTAAGTLTITLEPPFTPQPGDEYLLIDANTILGAFTTINVDALAGLNPDTSTLLTDGTLRFAASCNAADLATPFGILDLADIDPFITGVTTNDPIADIAAPFGVIDLVDIDAFILAFLAGCP